MAYSDDLVTVLSDLGVDVRRVSGDEINARCPVHHLVKGRESSRFSWYMNSESGLWHCFTCGARGNLSSLVSDLTDDPSALWQIQRHLITSGIRRLTTVETEIQEALPAVNWSEYTKYELLPQSILTRRNIDDEVARRYGIRWDTKLKAVVIPIVSPVGELWGWQLKKTGWVRNHPVGVHKSMTLFGIERAYAPSGLLLESPLDVVRFHSVYGGSGVSAVASFGANISKQQISVLADRFDQLIVAMDNDTAGKMETRRLIKSLPSFRKGIRFWSYSSSSIKDLGDMSDFQILRGLNRVSSVYV